MSRADLKRMLKPVAKAMQPKPMLMAQQRVANAINDDGTINPTAARSNSSLQVAAWYIAGPQVIGNNQGMEYRMPERSKVFRYDVYVKTAPSPGSLICRFMANGVMVRTITIAAGTTSAFATTPLRLDGGDIIRVDVTQIGGAAPGVDLTMLMTYQSDIAG